MATQRADVHCENEISGCIRLHKRYCSIEDTEQRCTYMTLIAVLVIISLEAVVDIMRNTLHLDDVKIPRTEVIREKKVIIVLSVKSSLL